MQPVLLNEKELFTLLASGNEAAFTQIFDYFEPQLFPFILKITRSQSIAEEVVQEIFIKLWINRTKMGDVENHRAYIFKMATNKTMNYLRDLARKSELI